MRRAIARQMFRTNHLYSKHFLVISVLDSQGSEDNGTHAKIVVDHQKMTSKWDFIVPPIASDSSLSLKGSKKEMQKIKKQLAVKQKRLQALHQQHLINKAHYFEDYGSSMLGPPSHFQIMQWNKQFRQKAKKVWFYIFYY